MNDHCDRLNRSVRRNRDSCSHYSVNKFTYSYHTRAHTPLYVYNNTRIRISSHRKCDFHGSALEAKSFHLFLDG